MMRIPSLSSACIMRLPGSMPCTYSLDCSYSASKSSDGFSAAAMRSSASMSTDRYTSRRGCVQVWADSASSASLYVRTKK